MAESWQELLVAIQEMHLLGVLPQAAILVIAGMTALYLHHLIARLTAADTQGMRHLTQRTIQRLAFPISMLLVVLLGRTLLVALEQTYWVLDLAVPLLISFALITYVSLDDESDVVSALGGTTSLLLLAVFTIVNIAVLVLRRDRVDADHFRAPPGLPVVGVITSAYLVLPFSGRDAIQYELAGLLLLLGLILYGITILLNRRLGVRKTTLDPAKLDG